MELMVSQPQRNIAATPKAVRMPVIYEEAVRDLIACRTLDEAKYFVDKAEALAAWSRIYKSPEALLEAKRLKLHAYRRLGELAKELRPRPSFGNRRGSGPGPRSALLELGMSTSNADIAARMREIPKKEFDALIASPSCPSPTTLKEARRRGTSEWRKFSSSVASFRSFCRMHDGKSLGSSMSVDEAVKARESIVFLQEWLDEFERFLPKESK